MRRRLQLIRLSLGGAILIALAASLQGQPTTWRTQFENHSYNISAGGFGGYTSNSSPHVTIPFSVTQSGDSSEGTLEVKYPDVLPEGSFSTVGNQYYLVLSSPVTVGFHLEFDYIAARVDPPITISTYLNLEISSGSNTDNPPCKLVSEQRNLTSGTTTHFVKDFQCTFSKVAATVGDPNVGGQVLTIANYIDLTTFPHGGFGGFLATVYSQYRTLGNSDVRSIEPEVVSNDPNRGDVRVKIRGTNFESGSTVSFGAGIHVSGVTANTGTEIEALIGVNDHAPEGYRDVTVTRPGGATQVGKNLLYVSSLGPKIDVNQGVPIDCSARPCIADHPTWVRVRIPCYSPGCGAEHDAVTGRLFVNRNGAPIPGSPFRSDPQTLDVHEVGDTEYDLAERHSAADALNFRFTGSWLLDNLRAPEEGTYDFTFEIDARHPTIVPTGSAPDRNKNLVQELTSQPFRRSLSDRAIHVIAVADQAPAFRRLNPIDPLPLVDFTRAAYPVSRDLVTIAPPLFSEQFGPDLQSTLERLANHAIEAEVRNQPATTYVVMFTTDVAFDSPGASYCQQGACPGRSSVIKWEGDNSRAPLAHELGHHLRFGDTYINPPPDVGGEDRTPLNPPCSSLSPSGCPVEDGHIDTILGTQSLGLPPGDSYYATYTKRDVMGNAPRPQRWIDRRTWDHLYQRFMSGAGPQRAQLQERWLVVRGRVGADESVTFKPFLSYTGTETGAAIDEGDYRVEVLDAQGSAVSGKAFPVSFKLPHSTQASPWAPFQATLLFPATASRVVVKKGPRELGSKAISANPPTVTVTAPNGGETIATSTTVTWTASDPDGDVLTYDVLYSDGMKWSVLATDLTSTSQAWTTGMSPGSSNARIMVVASDGVHSTTDTSDASFSVPGKAPLVTFTAPGDGAAFPAGQPVTLSGFAYDLEEGELGGPSLTYTSDRSGPLGTGSDVVAANLPVGVHTITLRAVDAAGNPSTAQIHITVFTPAADLNVVPVVGSTPGSGGSFFKTAVQIHNPTSATVAGNFVYHPQGQGGSSADPAKGYMLLPGQSLYYADLLPELGQSGLGSVDLVATFGPAPTSVVRIFNDAGAAGTTGMTEELIRGAEALEQGTRGILIAPPEPARARFNIGVRSLGSGATVRFAVRDASGAMRATGSKFYPPVYFAQQAAEAFLGIALLANDTISFEVDAGSAIVYGATTDNTTQDPSLQFARPLSAGSSPRGTIAAVAAAAGVLDSLFRTTLQLHNPTSSPISGRLVFHPAGTSGSDADPSITYALAAGATASYADVLAAFGRTGLGSLDIIATSGSVPLAVARVFNDGGARGTTGFSVAALRPEDALQAGETGVLIAPADPVATRFNIGIRTLTNGAALTIAVRNRSGEVLRTLARVYPADYFLQQGGTEFLGAAPGPSDSVSITVDAGSAIVYGASTDNKTQDPAIQVARAVP